MACLFGGFAFKGDIKPSAVLLEAIPYYIVIESLVDLIQSVFKVCFGYVSNFHAFPLLKVKDLFSRCLFC